MRTTVTFEDDVAAQLQQLQKRRGLKPKQAINLALREGLRQLEGAKGQKRTPYRVEPMDLGPCLVGSLDDVSEVLAIAEGEDHK